MKAYRIDHAGVREVDVDPDALLAGETRWDCVSLDANRNHDIWVDDFGLSNPDAYYADKGHHWNIPLPAYIFGGEGENTVAATLDLEAVRSMTRLHEGVYNPADGFPMLAMDVKMDSQGRLQPWRAVLAFQMSLGRSHEYLMRLPDDRYFTPPGDDVRGSYLHLPIDVATQARAILAVLRGVDCGTVRIPSWLTSTSLARALAEEGISFEQVDMHVPLDAEMDDVQGIGGGPGHQIAHMADPALRARRFAENASVDDMAEVVGATIH